MDLQVLNRLVLNKEARPILEHTLTVAEPTAHVDCIVGKRHIYTEVQLFDYLRFQFAASLKDMTAVVVAC